MSLADFIVSYFTSVPTLFALGLLYSAIGILAVAFRSRRNPLLRTRILAAIFGLLIFGWLVLASSIYFCNVFLRVYEQVEDVGIISALSFALITSLIGATAIALISTKVMPRRVLLELRGRLREPPAGASKVMEKVKKLSGLTTVSLRQSGSNLPFAYSVGGDEGRIIVSSRLLELLSEDELETVLGHELAHIKNSDTRLKILLTAYRRILFFDPLLRRIEKSVSKENEFAADEFSANLTRRPLSLASALLKISSADLSPNTTSAALSVLDEESQLRPSAVRSRIVRLLAIADSMVHHPSLAPLETREVAAMKEEVYAAV